MPRPPDVPADILRQLRGAARSYAKSPEDMQDPPWSLTDRKYREPDDAAVAGAVYAAHMAPPSDRAELEPWLVRGVLRLNGRGRIILQSVCVEHLLDPDLEVTSTVLHRLPIARIRDQALAYLRIGPIVEKSLAHVGGAEPTPAEKRRIERIAEAAAPLRRGSVGYPLEHFRRIALRALEISKTGRRDVLKQLAADESERAGRIIPYQTVRDWVARARAEEFLAPTERGHSVWMAGSKLYVREDVDG